jgi:hypothetical protein
MKTLVTVRFASGREEKFEMDLWGGTRAQARLQAFAENPTLILQTNDEVIVIPSSAIECISIKVAKGDSRFNLKDIRPATRVE